ncbi:hypothetical protein NS183_07660 [Microbacterium testaceum]|uniref:tyrosine-type recombinase/integrase n=1 Tax=Microbacterium testaceum TaxID=2033 RepID=UPI00073502CE|nr:site-specific integrase [Microbacterium testaceum]KTS90656.1 hypothetical protein NS183_07660 [Microbacterium testaceum]
MTEKKTIHRVRGAGEGAIYRVPADRTKPLKYWVGAIELPQHNGDRRKKVIRRKDKKVLTAELAKLRAELEDRGDLPTANQTVEQWFTYWVEKIAAKNVRPNTLDGYRRATQNHIIPAIGKVKLDKLTPTHIRRVHDAVLAKGLSSTTALLVHRTMATSLKIAMREGRIGRNPANLTEAPRKAATQLHALDLSESVQFLRYAATDEAMGARWATALLTGARRGEVIGLERDRVSDVLDLSWQLIRLALTEEHGRPDVPADYEYRHIAGGLYLTRPKASKSWRIIPLINPLRDILERHLAVTPDNEWGLVFTNNGRPISPDADSRNWRAALKAAGIEKDVRLHDARHTTVDLLYAARVPEDIIQEIIGHSTRTMTQAYKSLGDRDRLTAGMQQLSALFRGEGERP